MRIRILGTAAAEGWPAPFCDCPHCKRAAELGGKDIRTRAATLLDDDTLLDFGPDLYMQSLRAGGIPLYKINHVLVTHAHMDHFMRDMLFLTVPPFGHNHREKPMVIYGSADVEKECAIFTFPGHELPSIRFERVHAFEKVPVDGGYALPLPALHDRSQECFIYMVEKNGKRMLYGHDTNVFPAETLEALAGMKLDFVMLDCTMGLMDNPLSGTHMNFANCVQMKKALLENGAATEDTQFIITHFSHNIGLTHAELEALAAPEGFGVAYDHVCYEL